MRVEMTSTWLTGPMGRKMDTTATPDEGAPAATAAAPPQAPERPDGHVAVNSKAGEQERGEPSLVERLVEQGFVNYVEQMQAEKREKMREEILAAMGLSEEMLEGMPGEQRAAIEKLVEEEIQRRMAGAAMVNKEADDQKAQPGELTIGRGNLAQGPAGTNGLPIDKLGVGMGLGPLLALQEVAVEKAESENADATKAPGKKDPAS